MRNYDLEFLKRFSLVIGFLALVTLALIVLAAFLHRSLPAEVSPAAQARVQARIAPAGAAYGGTLDGKVIYDNLCGACHTTGVGMAPTLQRAQWSARIAQGNDVLYRHAIEGFTGAGIMPPKGGNPGLTDEQVKATVDWMLGNLQ